MFFINAFVSERIYTRRDDAWRMGRVHHILWDVHKRKVRIQKIQLALHGDRRGSSYQKREIETVRNPAWIQNIEQTVIDRHAAPE